MGESSTSVETSVKARQAAIALDEFRSTFQRLFGRLQLLGHSSAINIATWRSLREIFMCLTKPGSDVSAYGSEGVSCIRCAEDSSRPCQGGEEAVVMDTRAEFNLLMSVEILANRLSKDRRHHDAYGCYNLAYAYYMKRFNRDFVKSRDIRRKMAGVLLEWGQFDFANRELKVDAQLNDYGTPLAAKATLFIQYVYGQSLLAVNLSLEAVPYLSQQYLGQMNIDVRENKEILNMITRTVMEQLILGRIDFVMSMAVRLLNIFTKRMRQGDCPEEVFDFTAILSSRLQANNYGSHFMALHRTASEIHANVRSADSQLLLSAIGCTFPEESPQFKEAMEMIGQAHNRLASSVNGNDKFTLGRLKVTTKLIYIWADRDRAMRLILDVCNKMFEVLDKNDPYLKFFIECANGRMWSED